MFGRKARRGEVIDDWQLYEGSHDGRRLVARFNVGAKPLVGAAGYEIQVGVAIPLRHARDDGMPDNPELDELASVEDQIVGMLAGRGRLVGVLTTGGMREFVIYTGQNDWISDFAAALQAAVTSHEVQVMAQRDPNWSVYRQFVQ